MISKRLYLPLALVLVSGLIAAGCGGGNDTSSDSVATTTQTTQTTGGGGTGGGGTSGGGSTNAAVQAAIDGCKQAVNAAPTLSASEKSDLDNLCEKASSGDIKQAQQASVQVCEKIAQDTIPAGSAQDQAVAACKAAAP